MAIVTTDNQYYSAIANAIRAKNGLTTTYLPSEMAAAITAIPTGSGGGLDFLTNETDYGVAIYQNRSETSSSKTIVLPDGITFDDVKFIIGTGYINNSSGTLYNDSRFGTYIYCPDLYDRAVQNDLGTVYNACFGTFSISYGSNYFQGIDYARDYRSATRGATQDPYFYWVSYNETDNSISLYVSDTHSKENPTNLYQGYMICDYGRVAVIYDQRGVA